MRNKNYILPLILFLSLSFILSMVISAAHETDPEKDNIGLNDDAFLSEEVYFSHIHGVGYNSDGDSILVASHVGIMLYTDGQWMVSKLPAHDYMGFASIDEGFYSSGHPALDTDLMNPLGLVKVTENENELTSLAFEGVFDFHQLAAGYYNHAIYVINHFSSPELKPGLNYTLDEGNTWNQRGKKRIAEKATQIAVHPTDASMVAIATTKGLYLSNNYGSNLAKITDNIVITAVSFSPDGQFLIYGHKTLKRYRLSNRITISIPHPDALHDDFIAYLAVNPMNSDEIVLATSKKNIFIWNDQGNNWKQVAREGKGF
jgi:WD40 repeat protein